MNTPKSQLNRNKFSLYWGDMGSLSLFSCFRDTLTQSLQRAKAFICLLSIGMSWPRAGARLESLCLLFICLCKLSFLEESFWRAGQDQLMSAHSGLGAD